jgi:hypothetical protein
LLRNSEIDRLMRDVPVAAENHFAPGLAQLCEMRQERIEKAVLRRLPMLAARARRQIQADHGHVAKVRLEIAALGIELRGAESRVEFGRDARVEPNAGVALSSARREARVRLARRGQRARNVVVTALISCTQTTSHGCPRVSQRRSPRRSAERMPLTLSVMMRMRWRKGGRRKRRRVYTSDALRSPGESGAHTRYEPRHRPSRVYSTGSVSTRSANDGFSQEFLAFALARDVLRFGEFITKAGRRTPYFFNAGLFCDGASLRELGRFYAEAWLASGIGGDHLFGPAYKGITLAAAMAIALAEKGRQPAVQLQPEGGQGPLAKAGWSSARRCPAGC